MSRSPSSPGILVGVFQCVEKTTASAGMHRLRGTWSCLKYVKPLLHVRRKVVSR
jgi:hypothetical protein